MNVDYNTETQEITVELNTPAIEFDTPTGGRGLKGETGSTGPQGPQGIQGIQGIQGEKGDTGEDGYTPIKGVDYFTEEDIESLNIPTKTSDLNNDSGFITSSSLPTKVSDLQNDTGFITNTVNNLTNYYTSSTTYTKSEVDSLIATVSSLDIEVVQTLPTHDISTSTIYLVPNSSHGTNNYYDEYIYVSNSWELIGSTQVDLSNYYTKTETDTLLGNKQDALVSGTNIKTINGSSILGNGNIDVATDITLSATTENGTWYLQSKKGIYWVTGATKFNLGVGASDLSFLGDKVMMFMQVIDQSDVSALNDGDTVAYAVHFLESTSNSGQIKIYNEYYRIKYDSSKSSKLVYASGNAAMLDDIASLTYMNTALGNKQDALVSGTNIKTINNTSILGSGNIEIGGSTADVYYVPSTDSSSSNPFVLEEHVPGVYIFEDSANVYIKVLTTSSTSRLSYGPWAGTGFFLLTTPSSEMIDGDIIAQYMHFGATYPYKDEISFKYSNEYKYQLTSSSQYGLEWVNINSAQTISSLKTFSTLPQSSVVPSDDKDLANKKYVDDAVSGGGGTPTNVKINGTSITSNNVADIQTKGTYNSSTNKIATISDVPKVYYGTSSTGASTAAKVVTCSGFVKETGAIIFVKFTNGNSYNGTATLNVNSTNASDIATVGDTKTSRYYWKSGEIVGFIYDGTNYVMIEQGNATTTYYGVTKLSNSTSSTSEVLAATPKAVKAAYDLANGKQNAITSTNKLDYSLIDNTPTIPSKTSDLTNDSGFITGYTETDPIFSASAAAGITSSDITSWNNKSTFSGNYNDLTNKPTIPDELSDLSDDSTHRLVTDTEKSTWNNKSDFSGSYNDLTNKPTIPTVNDATLTIQKNGTTINTFTANASSNKTVNVTVPTKVSDLTNDSGFITSYTETDPVFTASAAAGITSSNISDWNTKMDSSHFTGDIRIMDLDDGVYISDASNKKLYYYGTSDTTNYIRITSGTIVIVSGDSSRKTFVVTDGLSAYYGYSSTSGGDYEEFIVKDDIVNNLTTSTTGKVLDASQGKALKDTLDATTSTSISNMNNIGTLTNLTTTAKTDLVSAINEVNEIANVPYIDLGDILDITSKDDEAYKKIEANVQTGFYIHDHTDLTGAAFVYPAFAIEESANKIRFAYIYRTYATGNNDYDTVEIELINTSGKNVTVNINTVSKAIKDIKINNNSLISNNHEVNLLTNTAYNSSTNPIATMGDIPTPNIMTVYLAADYSIPNTNTVYNLTNTAVSSSVGSKLTFRNGKIVIGAGVSKVKVSYTAKSVSAANQTRTFTYLMQDINGVATALSQEGHWYGSTNWQVVNTYGPITLNVNQGDAFYLSCYGYKNNVIAGATSSFMPTILTVEVIE